METTQKTLKEMIQAEADYAIKHLKELEASVIEERDAVGGEIQAKETKSFPMLREFYGRIYAIRSIGDILGLEINTNLITQ